MYGTSIFVVASAYLLGSVSFAVLVSTAMGLKDPRTYGSKNPGATNVLRSGNKLAAVLTLIGDSLKGWLAVYLAKTFAEQYNFGDATISLVALAVFLGHLFPIYHRFVGGKGVATAAGILLAVNIWLGLATLGVWIVIAVIFKYSSLAALIAAIFAPLFQFIVFGEAPMTIAVGAIGLLLIWRHRLNIGRLLRGEESRLNFGASK